MVMDKLKEALEQKNDSSIEANIKVLKEVFNDIHNKDYDHEVDRKVAKALLPLYAEMIPAGQRPAIYDVIEQRVQRRLQCLRRCNVRYFNFGQSGKL